MTYNEYTVMNANINKNLIGDTLVLKPVKSKGMPA
jgi:hypothetical protein